MSNLYIKAPAPSTGEWVRPSGWLPMPAITSGDTQVAILVAVYENEINETYFNVDIVGTATINIDWGNGDSNDYTGTSQFLDISKFYDYASISSVVLQDDLGYDYKQVMINISLVSGSYVRSIYLAKKYPSPKYKNTMLDILASWLPTFGLHFCDSATNPRNNYTYLQRVSILPSITYANKDTNFFMAGLTAIRSFSLPKLSDSSNNVYCLFVGMNDIDFGDIDWGITGGPSPHTWFSPVNSSHIFQTTRVKSFGNISLPNVGQFNNQFSSIEGCISMGNINIPNASATDDAFGNNNSLRILGEINAPKTTNINNMFRNCYSLKEIKFISSLNLVTSGGNYAFSNCLSLEKLRVPGLKISFSIADTLLNRDALVQVFNDLGTPATTQTITVTRTPGSADLTAGDIAIATGKNWTVVL